jgi:hypothetical protein
MNEAFDCRRSRGRRHHCAHAPCDRRPPARRRTDPKALIEAIQASFAEFKAQNDARLKQLEGRGEDPITAEQVNKINADLSALTKAVEKAQADAAAARLGGGGGDALTPEAKAHAGAFNGVVPQGDRAVAGDAGARDCGGPDDAVRSGRRLSGADGDGEHHRPRARHRVDRPQPRQGHGDRHQRIQEAGQHGRRDQRLGRRGRDPRRHQHADLREIAINVAEIYAQPAATQTSLDDSRIDVAAWLGDEVSIEFAEQEGDAFVNGNGVKKPRGFLQYPTVANASYAWGSLGYVRRAMRRPSSRRRPALRRPTA